MNCIECMRALRILLIDAAILISTLIMQRGTLIFVTMNISFFHFRLIQEADMIKIQYHYEEIHITKWKRVVPGRCYH